MPRSSNIHILSASDNSFAQHLGVTIASLLENSNHPQNIVYSVIDGGISDTNKKKLVSLFNKYGAKVKFLKVDKKIFEKYPTTDYWPTAIYYRLLIPQLLDSSIKKVIYLDCDLVIKDDINNLWNVDIKDYPMAAVADNEGKLRFADLNLPEDSIYFNSGVMVLNLEFWRENNIGEKIIDYIDKNTTKLLWPDQDALNVILYNNWKPLHPKWNFQRNILYLLPQEQIFDITTINRVLKEPSIIHFTTSSKPWFYNDEHPFKNEYYYYLSFTEWRNFKQVDKTLINVFKKSFKVILPKPLFNILKKMNEMIKVLYKLN
ncbi:glycosyltransferase family 8 protein [Bacillus sp. UNC41MFS5]|uniref:glycosyltransferase family 8 protein n=1 Tax=Bacillus sp. UNC41MFS5 TaxID=1449046 RepID=UPI00068BDA59|nr:glycosyltransferase family 8 protein [Bacillus sp. UNC41MFS5]